MRGLVPMILLEGKVLRLNAWMGAVINNSEPQPPWVPSALGLLDVLCVLTWLGGLAVISLL